MEIKLTNNAKPLVSEKEIKSSLKKSGAKEKRFEIGVRVDTDVRSDKSSHNLETRGRRRAR